MQALIIDLRRNPGGLLDQAVEVCSKFLPRGQLVVTTEGRNPGPEFHPARRRTRRRIERDAVVVLVNLGSASAAEIVAGCLQDLHRAMISAKKLRQGIGAEIIPLHDGSALSLTTAKYYTPSHKVIHRMASRPTLRVPMAEEQEAALLLKRAPGGLESSTRPIAKHRKCP